jgi:ABC-type transport system involved in cytochrome bd biosynthesis fused ATPase/permease subunit
VIVVNQGQVVEEGSHDELLSHDGIYKKLVLRQLMAGDHSINDSSDVLPIYPL